MSEETTSYLDKILSGIKSVRDIFAILLLLFSTQAIYDFQAGTPKQVVEAIEAQRDSFQVEIQALRDTLSTYIEIFTEANDHMKKDLDTLRIVFEDYRQFSTRAIVNLDAYHKKDSTKDEIESEN